MTPRCAPGISDTLQVRLDSSDVPTVQTRLTNSLTPQLGGTAQKISGAGFAALGPNDLLVVGINGKTYTLEGGTTREVVDSANWDALWGANASTTATYAQSTTASLTYDATLRTWQLSLPTGVITSAGTYDVKVGVKAEGDVLKTDSSGNELAIQTAAPTLSVDTLSTDGYLNASEKTAAGTGNPAHRNGRCARTPGRRAALSARVRCARAASRRRDRCARRHPRPPRRPRCRGRSGPACTAGRRHRRCDGRTGCRSPRADP